MKLVLSTLFSITCLLTSFITVGSAVQPNEIKTLQQLFDEVKAKQKQAVEINKQREDDFLSAKSQQKNLLYKAEQEFRKIKQQNKPLINQTKENKAEIKILNDKLKTEIAALGDIYSVLNQFTSEVNQTLTGSMTQGQYPERKQVLNEIATNEIPDVALITQYWLTLQHEMTQAANIATFPAQVIDSNGVSHKQQVTRIANFTAFSEGKYLQWLPISQEFLQFQRQPDFKLLEAAQNFSMENNSFQLVVVDPSQGKLLAMLGDKARIDEQIHAGGSVGYIILSLGALGLLISLYRFMYLFIVKVKVNKQLTQIDKPLNNNPLGRILLKAVSNNASDTRLEYELDEAVLNEIVPLERGLGFLKVLTGVAPLLGLLGTITGMIETFQLMSLYGSGDAKMMSSGISQALVTTALGLIVAIPLVFAHSIISTRSKRIIHLLDEQSAGLMTQLLEKLEKEEAK